MNQEPDIWCERSFAPWGDMEEEMRKAEIPLYALESGDPLASLTPSDSLWAMRWHIPMF